MSPLNIFSLLLVGAGILPIATAQLPPQVGKPRRDFEKDGVPAHWAPGHPMVWGSEDAHYNFGTPDTRSCFQATVTDDEKYHVMTNGTHIQFTDLNTGTLASTIPLQQSDGSSLAATVGFQQYQFWAITTPQDGYSLVFNGLPGTDCSRTQDSGKAMRQRFGADLQPLGAPTVYDSPIRAITSSAGGRLVTTSNKIYDLTQPETTPTPLAIPFNTSASEYSFSSNGELLVRSAYYRSGNDYVNAVELWNMTSGQEIAAFDGLAQLGAVSPDGRYVAFTRGRYTGVNVTVEVYETANTGAPRWVGPLREGWVPEAVEWSPTSRRFAVVDMRRLRIFDVDLGEVVDTWETNLNDAVIGVLKWLDGGKICWVVDGRFQRWMYDLETNQEWVWTPRTTSQAWGQSRLDVFLLKKQGKVVTIDGDDSVRVWKV